MWRAGCHARARHKCAHRVPRTCQAQVWRGRVPRTCQAQVWRGGCHDVPGTSVARGWVSGAGGGVLCLRGVHALGIGLRRRRADDRCCGRGHRAASFQGALIDAHDATKAGRFDDARRALVKAAQRAGNDAARLRRLRRLIKTWRASRRDWLVASVTHGFESAARDVIRRRLEEPAETRIALATWARERLADVAFERIAASCGASGVDTTAGELRGLWRARKRARWTPLPDGSALRSAVSWARGGPPTSGWTRSWATSSSTEAITRRVGRRSSCPAPAAEDEASPPGGSPTARR